VISVVGSLTPALLIYSSLIMIVHYLVIVNWSFLLLYQILVDNNIMYVLSVVLHIDIVS